MKILSRIVVAGFVLLAFALPSVAAETALTKVSFMNVDPADAQEKVIKTQALALKKLDFEVFAKEKIRQLNRNHKFSRSRMKISKKADGSYLGRYHQIEDSTMAVKVRRSQSRTIPYVGVLSYKEQVFESSAKSIDQLKEGSFAVVEVIPNRHIFSYQKGAWK